MKPIAVSPKIAFDMLNVGQTKGYELLNDGELESFTIGRSRKITVSSIEALVARRLAEEEAASLPISRDQAKQFSERIDERSEVR